MTLKPSERIDKAKELIDCLGLWGINVTDARSIAHTMLMRLNRMKPNEPIIISAKTIPKENKQRFDHMPNSDREIN